MNEQEILMFLEDLGVHYCNRSLIEEDKEKSLRLGWIANGILQAHKKLKEEMIRRANEKKAKPVCASSDNPHDLDYSYWH